MKTSFVLPSVLAFVAMVGALAASEKPAVKSAADLTGLSLDDLLKVEVEIVSRKAEPVAEAAAAVSVITGDDIRRSGAQTLPEILRLAPGVNVARQNGNFWAVSIRGFQDVFANKLLVLMDGRSVYTPLFSGTFWDVQDTLLPDIDRVEIIRGPGATAWGANAVNGVINIRTKSAVDTQGTLVSAGYGSELQGIFSLRHGLKLSDDLFLRLYGKHGNQDHLRTSAGLASNDGLRMGRGGFRMDWLPPGGVELTLQGEVYGGKVENVYVVGPPVFNVNGVGGGHLLGRLERQIGDGELSVQAYYDRSVRQSIAFEEDRDTGDLEARYTFAVGSRHDLVVGAGYRVSSDDVANLPVVSFNPSERVTHLASFFFQDTIDLVPDRLTLTLGSKFQHNQFTGFEIQPSARLRFRPTEGQTVWAAVSRAVRTPSRTDDDVIVNGFSPTLGFATQTRGTRAIESEQLLAW
jgi:iron complex outermembrane receptor protein